MHVRRSMQQQQGFGEGFGEEQDMALAAWAGVTDMGTPALLTGTAQQQEDDTELTEPDSDIELSPAF